MFRFFLFLIVVVTAFPVMAEESIGTKLQLHQKKKETLEQEIKQIEQDLTGTRSELVNVSKSVQNNEKTLEDLERRIQELESESDEIKKILQEDRKSVAGLVLALERIRRVPPEAMIAKPDAPFKTAQSALLMGEIMPLLYQKAENLKANLENLDKVSKDLKSKHEQALKTSKNLEEQQEKLSGLVEKREKLFADTHADLESEKENVKKISQQAQNLADLVTRLKKDRTANSPKSDVKVSFGQTRLPVSGIVRTRYDEPDSFGSPSKGISIEAREGALVVAPMGGIVRFTGRFKNYGNIIILEHQKGYHSLIAGLEKIDTVVGQSVSAGEAIGFLHKADSPGEKPALYYELRLDGRPINPAAKFSDLG